MSSPGFCIASICYSLPGSDCWACCRDADDVQAAQSYFQKPLSYRDMKEPGLFEKQKQVLQDSAMHGERFSTEDTALTVLMQMKQDIRSLR